MTRFYGPGTQKISATLPKGFQAQKAKPEGPPNQTVGLNLLGGEMSASSTVIRFVLKSGAALELTEDSIEEVVGGWADRLCNSICGKKVDGTKVCFDVKNVDYMEEA